MTIYLSSPSPLASQTVLTKNFQVKGASDGQAFQNTTFSSSYTMVFQTMPAGVGHTNLTFKDCFINGNTHPGNKWGAHCIGIMSGRADRVYATAHNEHAFYWEIPGGYEFVDCTSEAGSQGWQIEDREFTSSGANMWPTGYDRSQMKDVTWRRCWARECGQPYGDRPSYAFALYREAGHYLLENCQVTRGLDNGMSSDQHMRALLMRGKAPTLEIHGGVFDYAEPDRALVYLMSGAGALITRAHFPRGVIEIGKDMKNVVIKGCTGGAVIRTPDGKSRPVTQGIEY